MKLRYALSMLLLGVLIAVINFSATRIWEQDWGGPNVLAGLIQLVAYAVVVAGMVLTIIAIVQRRHQSHGG